MAKVTIVSTLPMKLREEKPGQNPSIYIIQPAENKKTVGVTHIDNGYYVEPIPLADSKAPLRRIDLHSDRIAQAIINDYVNACLGVQHDVLENGSQRVPGLFWVGEKLSATDVLSKHSADVEQARKNTIAWFKGLVDLADDDWQKNRQHKMITDLQRTACSYLELEREWNRDILAMLQNLCPSCKTSIHPEAIVCFNCRFILNKKKYEEQKANFATV